MKRENKNIPVLVVGSQRSGTTLLNRILNSHPDIGLIYQQTEFLRKNFENCISFDDEAVTRLVRETKNFMNGYELVFSDETEHQVLSDIFGNENAINIGIVYEAIVRGLLKSKRDISRWGEKYAGRCLELSPFLEHCPNGKIIHIFRDLRDVYCSEKKRLQKANQAAFQDGTYLLTVYDWKIGAQLMNRYRNMLSPESYMTISYESLTADPQSSCRKICGFLEVPFAEEMLEISSATDMQGKQWTANSSFESEVKTIRIDFAGRWRKLLEKGEITFLEKFCYDELVNLGYLRKSKIHAFYRYLPSSKAIRRLINATMSMAEKYAEHPSYFPFYPPSAKEGFKRKIDLL